MKFTVVENTLFVIVLSAWILWTRLTKLNEPAWRPVTLSVVAGNVGLWQTTQNLVSMRPPPWNESGSWHLLQDWVVTSFLLVTIAVPFGTRSKVGFATGAVRAVLAVKVANGRPEIWIAARVVTLS